MNKQTLQVDEGVSVALCVFEPEGAPRASVVIGGAGGAVVGGAVGAVRGSFGSDLGVGAAAGAAAGLVSGVFKASEPSPLYKSFVNRCLSTKGYEVIGWGD